MQKSAHGPIFYIAVILLMTLEHNHNKISFQAPFKTHSKWMQADISAAGAEATCGTRAGKEPAGGSSALFESCEGTAFQQEVKSTEPLFRSKRGF